MKNKVDIKIMVKNPIFQTVVTSVIGGLIYGYSEKFGNYIGEKYVNKLKEKETEKVSVETEK